MQGSVVRYQQSGAHTYYLIRVPVNSRRSPGSIDGVMCSPNVPCFGALDPSIVPGATGNESTVELILYLPRHPAATVPKEVRWYSGHRISNSYSSFRQVAGGRTQRVLLANSSPKPATDLDVRFLRLWGNFWEELGKKEPYGAFVSARLNSRLGRKDDGATSEGPARPDTDITRLMDFYTGNSEIRQALMIERGLGKVSGSSRQTIDIKEISGVTATERNYLALRRQSPDLQMPAPFPLAKTLPDDVIAVEFPTVKDLVTLPKILDQRLGLLLQSLEERPGSSWLFERYRRQLALEISRLAEQFGDLAIGSVAVAFGDPYLREGTDVSIVFEVRRRDVLEGVLNAYLEKARKERPDLGSSTQSLAGFPVTLHATDDGRIRRYQAWMGSWLFLSNSPGALTKVLLAASGKAPSLAQSLDYQWARSITPYSPNDERAFAFFGDRLIQKIMGPRSKILEARRTIAQSDLRSVEYASLLHAMMEGGPAASVDEMLHGKWLLSEDLRHPDRSPIAWSSKYGASSSWGNSELMLPIVDLTISKVSEQERRAYDDFRSGYEGMYHERVDPSSFRVLRTSSDNNLKTELRVLPLTRNGEMARDLHEAVRMFGHGSIDPGAAQQGISLAVGMEKNQAFADLSRELIHFGDLAPLRASLDFLGSWIKVGMLDDSWAWNLAVRAQEIPSLDSGRSRMDDDDLIESFSRAPFWAAVQIKNRLVLTGLLATLRATLTKELGDSLSWTDDAPYGKVSVSRVEIRASGVDQPITIFYSLAKDVLVVAMERIILEMQIDEVLAKRVPHRDDNQKAPAQVVLDLKRAGSSLLAAVAAAFVDREALLAHQTACDGLVALGMGLGEAPVNSSERSTLAWRYLGYEPESPAGPGLRLNGGQCEHPVFGTSTEPVVPSATDFSTPLHRQIAGIRLGRFGLGLVPRGDEEELVGTMEIQME